MKDQFDQELNIGDIIVVATTSNSYKFTSYIGIVYKINPKSISAYTKEKGINYNYSEEEICFLNTSTLKYKYRIIKLPKSKENIDMFLKDLVMEEDLNKEVTKLINL